MKKLFLLIILLFTLFQHSQAQSTEYLLDTLLNPPAVAEIDPEHSIARSWNEMLLLAIRNDLARPTVHARNLFHTSVLMYDLWASFNELAEPYLLGQTVNGANNKGLLEESFTCAYDGFEGERSEENLREAISFGMYRLLKHRFAQVYAVDTGLDKFMENLGYPAGLELNFTDLDIEKTTTKKTTLSEDDPRTSAAQLGNYLAKCIIAYGLQDGSNEGVFYQNEYYWSINGGLDANTPGNRNFDFPNRWQPLKFEGGYVDQSGNVFDTAQPIEFLGAEWGQVRPFALNQDDLNIYQRSGANYWVYHDPEQPPQISDDVEANQSYLWNFATVAKFSSQLDAAQSPMIDISPASLGNVDVNTFPRSQAEYEAFYSLNGGMMGSGYEQNPITQEVYTPQFVALGDYTRVLAEFWADGPDSETPPGHWFTILNYVTDHEDFSPRWGGQSDLLNQLEWDVKAYLTLGGAMHDSAVASWGIKGWYEYPRPISVIRYMAENGQSSDPNLPNYSVHGFPLLDGFSELVTSGDPLAGEADEHVGKVKILAWRGPDYIEDPETDTSGVSWILAEVWWPYQRPNFITPPFAGYISGHSTFSRAAAEVLTKLTGSPYFPGGLGEFTAKKNEFLVFEEGPSTDVVLQWAKYADAADQTSLSRIWGGIHPPVDDIPGRHLGIKIANNAFDLAQRYFNGK